jgi:hypothetical protein
VLTLAAPAMRLPGQLGDIDFERAGEGEQRGVPVHPAHAAFDLLHLGERVADPARQLTLAPSLQLPVARDALADGAVIDAWSRHACPPS